MYCTNCGAETQEDAIFCVNCGTPLEQSDSSTQSAPQVATPQPSNPQKKRIIFIAIAAVCLVVIVAIAVVGCTIMKKNNQAQELAHQKVAIGIQIEASGLDYATSTPVPMQLQGTNFSGDSVSQEFLYDGTVSSVPEVERGQYTISVLDSPISGDGTMYELTNPTTMITVTDYNVEEQLRELGHDELIGPIEAESADAPNVSTESADIALAPLAPIKVTNEMIDATCNTLERLGYDAALVTEHRQLVETKRDAAQKEQLEKQTTFSDGRVSLKVPASWGDHWTSSVSSIERNGGQTPDWYQYEFTNTANPSEHFVLSLRNNGKNLAMFGWAAVEGRAYSYYLNNEGLSQGDFDAVVSSVVPKL